LGATEKETKQKTSVDTINPIFCLSSWIFVHDVRRPDLKLVEQGYDSPISYLFQRCIIHGHTVFEGAHVLYQCCHEGLYHGMQFYWLQQVLIYEVCKYGGGCFNHLFSLICVVMHFVTNSSITIFFLSLYSLGSRLLLINSCADLCVLENISIALVTSLSTFCPTH
jgi:hypothetical protein